MADNKDYDVIILGGSYAGLSAAMALGRSLRSVLIIDSGLPCNRQTPYSHNFITHDGEKPSAIAEKAKTQVLNYETVKFLDDLAVGGRKTDYGIAVVTQSGKEYKAKKLIVTTGIKDLMPDIKGFAACWGISVIHCPYCHGYEFRDQETGIMANGERAFHIASLVNNLTDKLTILTSGKADFSEDQISKLQKNNIKIIEEEVAEMVHEHGHIKHLIFKDGSKHSFDAVYAAIPFIQHSDIPVAMGCELTELGHIKVDMLYKTSVANVFAGGDNTSPMRSVSNAVAAGNMIGAVVNSEITQERF